MNRGLRRAYGPTVKAVREARGLTIAVVAERAQISGGFLSKIERCQRFPEPDVSQRLADALDVPVEELTGQRPVIATLRSALGYDPDDFACDLGITRDLLDRVESGMGGTAASDLFGRLTKRLGVHPEALAASPHRHIRWVQEGRQVRIANGNSHLAGRVIAYQAEPSVLIETEDGARTWLAVSRLQEVPDPAIDHTEEQTA